MTDTWRFRTGLKLEPAPPLPAISSRRSPVDLDNDVEPEADPTDTIVESIQQAVGSGGRPGTSGPAREDLAAPLSAASSRRRRP